MAINKKLIHFTKGENFDTQKENNNILDSSICFIQDRKTIVTHGTEYKAQGWSTLPIKGVTIVDLLGNQHLVSEWSGGSNCTGIALINDNVSLIIAPDEWCTYKYNTSEADPAWNGNSRSAWGGYNTTVSGIKTTTSDSDAITDFAGSANTDAIISQLKGKTDDYSIYYTGAPAAEYCQAYSKGYKGAGQWYLPSAGEYNQIVQNASDINAAIAKVSGKSLDAYYYVWTSTQYSAYDAWCFDWSTEDFIGNSKKKRYDYGVRPVCAF